MDNQALVFDESAIRQLPELVRQFIFSYLDRYEGIDPMQAGWIASLTELAIENNSAFRALVD